MLLVIDNYDSFTYNLVQYLGELGAEPVVRRNDQVTVAEIASGDYAGIVISPGPGAAQGRGHQSGGHPRTRRHGADSRRLPRPSGHWRSLRRSHRARPQTDPRQGQPSDARRPRQFSTGVPAADRRSGAITR